MLIIAPFFEQRRQSESPFEFKVTYVRCRCNKHKESTTHLSSFKGNRPVMASEGYAAASSEANMALNQEHVKRVFNAKEK